MEKKNVFAKLVVAAMSVVAAGCATDGDEGGVLYEPGLVEKAYYNSPDGEAGEGNRFADVAENPFVDVDKQPVSTFSVDADGASYAVMRRYLASGYSVNAASVRIEEYLNYFTFDYPSPAAGHAVGADAEVGQCPWAKNHWLLRLGLKGKPLADSEVPQANFVFLIDVSGSMDSTDKLPLLKSGLKALLHELKPTDRISIITYSGEVKKLLESTPVKEIGTITTAIDKLTASGCTAGGEALKMAYEEALANYNPACNNRVIMGTDGDFNVGVTNTDALVEMVESYAKKGIYMTCLGFGWGNLNDAMMEKISNSGNGTYNYIDSEDEMMKVFVHERQQFVSVANDVKCQVTFDPAQVSQYRLIGYENRVLDNEDFENDEKDAGEIGAGQTVTALYELVPAKKFGDNDGKPLATFDVRYKKALNEASIPLSVEVWPFTESLSNNLNLAAGVAAYGMLLRNSEYKGDATFDMASDLVSKSLGFDPGNYRRQLLGLIYNAKEGKLR